ncbi:hypothetical protein [Stenotrophomonas panacihumi]|uniref:hypothetical protein n=1 Tax=Stenotrophomonas panacihumi TaxID=676599 RepID=UPI0011B25F89|nr:hypothetical protein [Stenotrophomonas panacihumi]
MGMLVYGLGMVVVGGLWFFVPFAIFGIKPLLQQLIAEQHATRAMLTAMATPAQRELAAEFLTPEPKPKLLERLRGK